MSSLDASFATRLKVGLFTVAALGIIGTVTILVNNKPYWWRPCQLVKIDVEDATGLKMKSRVQSMGVQIGFLKEVHLTETHVELDICITAPVEVLPSTRAYIRGEGFLGDRFVELKPVRYQGRSTFNWIESTSWADEEAQAADAKADDRKEARQIPVGETSQDMQAVVNKVDNLVTEVTTLATNLRQGINPEELRSIMKKLNQTLENASKTLSPEGGLNQTAQRTLSKLEAAVEQLRDVMTRINKGEGSIGKLINDPVYADELEKALKSLNKILGRASEWRFVVDIGGQELRGYGGGRGYFKFGIWPTARRYYLIGIAVDPRGRRTITDTTTTAGSTTTSTETTQVEETGILLTGMIGMLFFDRRLDLSVGALYGDGAISAGLNMGPTGQEERLQLHGDIYSRGKDVPTDGRVYLILRPYSGLYFNAGLESFRKVNGLTSWMYGAGVSFDDDDIKMLFTLVK